MKEFIRSPFIAISLDTEDIFVRKEGDPDEIPTGDLFVSLHVWMVTRKIISCLVFRKIRKISQIFYEVSRWPVSDCILFIELISIFLSKNICLIIRAPSILGNILPTLFPGNLQNLLNYGPLRQFYYSFVFFLNSLIPGNICLFPSFLGNSQ
jgi:hypothetical protein